MDAVLYMFPMDESPYHWQRYPMTSESAVYLGVNSVMFGIVLIVVALRMYSRVTTSKIGWDDWSVIFATCLTTLSMVVLVCFDVLGSGYLVQDVAINLGTIYLLIFIIQPLFLFTMAATKFSVCCFYLRVFVGRGMRNATKCTMVLVALWAAAHLSAGLFLCDPIAGYYDVRYVATAKCGDQSKFFQSGLSINVVLDAIIFALPLWTIWNLNMRTSDKVGLSITFSIGIGMIIVGIIRAIYVVNTALKGDVTGTLPLNAFFTVFEQMLAIITISIPMLRPLWTQYRSRATGYNLDDGGGGGRRRGGASLGKNSGGAQNDGTGGSELATIGGTGGKRSNPNSGKYGRHMDDSILISQFDGRDVEATTNIIGAATSDVDEHSIATSSGEWDSRGDAGSESGLGVTEHHSSKKGALKHGGSTGSNGRIGAIRVTEKWEVSSQTRE